MVSENPVTFGLVHGSWHGAWCWDLLRDELQVLGHRSIAMDMPIDDPGANFDDYTSVVVDALADEQDLIIVGHSRAGNMLPRAAGQLATKKLIYLASTFEPATIGRPREDEVNIMPVRNRPAFDQGIVLLGDGMTRFDRDLAKRLFLSDVADERIKEWAVNQWRPQRRSQNEPVLREWPSAPQEYIVCRDDMVLNPEWSRYVARNWLGVEPVEIDGGHSPFLSRPRELAKLLVSLAYN